MVVAQLEQFASVPARIRRRLRALRCSVDPSAVVVLGHQKSGTSAIAHLLADFGGLTKTIDIPEIWSEVGLIESGAASLAAIQKRAPRRFASQLLKEPSLTFMFDAVAEVFPEGRFVFVVRDPRDTIRSVLNRLAIPGNLMDCTLAIDDLPVGWQPVFDAQLWSPDDGHYITVLARRWSRAAETYWRHSERLHLVRYEDFLESKLGTIEAISKHLAIRRRNDISGRVDLQFQPQGNRDVSWEEFFGPENLKLIDEVCELRMRRFGYEPAF